MLEPSLPANVELPDSSACRRFTTICILFALLCLALKPMTWFAARAETDEQVHWTLARSLVDRGVYSLQGTGAIEALHLPPHTYDRPLFHHPPLLSVMLAPFAASRSPQAAILVSWLGHLLAIAGVSLACWAWREPASSGSEWRLWTPVLAVAVDPLLTFCSRKLWADGLVGGLDALGLGLTAMAVARPRVLWFIVAGLAFGLAGLTKLTGVLPIVPALIWAIFSLRTSASRTRFVACLALPIGLLVSPWLVWFKIKCGVWLPPWVTPPPDLIASVPHVARAVGRAWHYYLTESALVAPVFVACVAHFLIRCRIAPVGNALLGFGTIAVVGVTLAILGVRGQGLQMRYLTPGIGGLYLLLSAQLARIDVRRSLFPAIVMACVLFGSIQTGFYLQAVEFDEIVSLPEMAWRALTSTSANRGAGG